MENRVSPEVWNFAMTPVDRSHDALHRAGWPVGDARIITADGPAWWVSGTNGENRIEARAATQGEAWLQAVEQLGFSGP
jgi:hypothetical protein